MASVLLGAGIIAAVSGFVGVLVTQWATNRRERQSRTHAKLLKLIDKRYQLYMDYMDVLSKNHEIFSASGRSDLDGDEVLGELVPLEQEMQVFASRNVLSAAELFRDHLRWWARQQDPDDATVTEGRKMGMGLEVIVLEAIREDLGVDSYETRFGRWRQQMRVKRRVKASFKRNADVFAAGATEAEASEPDVPDVRASEEQASATAAAQAAETGDEPAERSQQADLAGVCPTEPPGASFGRVALVVVGLHGVPAPLQPQGRYASASLMGIRPPLTPEPLREKGRPYRAGGSQPTFVRIPTTTRASRGSEMPNRRGRAVPRRRHC